MGFLVEMLNITKTFPGILANDHINLSVRAGETHALLGENGAGKSTLMSILFGLYQPDEGEIRVRGKKVNITGPASANRLGIGMVHQHFKLVSNFTVLQNIILGVESARSGFLKMNEARGKVLEISERYGLQINPDALVEDISVGMQQRVELLKCLYRKNDIIILDEPTAVLTPQEIDGLLKIIDGLVKEGKAVIFITHKLNEIKAAAHRCTVLRRGQWIGTVEVDSISKEQLSEMMIGRKVNFDFMKPAFAPEGLVLEVKHLNLQAKRPLKDISFQVHAGEIVGIAGIEGNGQTELAQVIAGLLKADGGEILLNGTSIIDRPIRYRNQNGIGHIPEDRQKHGLVLDYSLAYNIILQQYFTPAFQKYGFLRQKEIRRYSGELIRQFDIRSSQGIDAIARGLSGGNQQKLILAREISRNPALLLAVQPTRGLDIGAIEFVHSQLLKQRKNHMAILLISLELEELLRLSDRILVIYEGELVASLNPQEVTTKELGLYMSGSKREVVS